MNTTTKRLIGSLPGFMLALGITMHASAAPLAGDAATGRKLHQTNCTGCHDAGVYQRSDRRITNLDALHEKINGCSHQVKKNFSRENINDLVKYLNEAYYKFK